MTSPSTFTEALARVGIDVLHITKPEAAQQVIEDLRRLAEGGPIGADLETTVDPELRDLCIDPSKPGLDPILARPRLLTLYAGGPAVAVDLDATGLEPWRDLIESDRLVFYNATFDCRVLIANGVTPGAPDCAMIAVGLVESEHAPRGLVEVAEDRLDVELPSAAHKRAMQSYDYAGDIDAEALAYAATDAVLAFSLWRASENVVERSLPAYRAAAGAIVPIAKMELKGLLLDTEAHALVATRWGDILEAEREAFIEHYGLKPSQRQKLAELVEETASSDLVSDWPRSKKTGRLELTKKALADADRKRVPVVADYIRANALATLYSSFGPSLSDRVSKIDGRLHGGFRIAGARTGRFSSSSPNLQNLPKVGGFRRLFRAPAGRVFVAADYSAVELRAAAIEAGETTLLDVFANPPKDADGNRSPEGDPHEDTARRLDLDRITSTPNERVRLAKACFTGDTEILTPSGWTRLDRYEGGPVAQYSPPAGVVLNEGVCHPGPGRAGVSGAVWAGEHGDLSFVDPVAFSGFHSDDVWEFEDRNVSIAATGDHELLYLDAYGRAHKRALAKISPGQVRHMIGAGHLKRGEFALDEVETRLLAMLVADGSWVRSKSVRLGFSKRRKVHRCETLLQRAGITFTKRVAKGVTAFRFPVEVVERVLAYTTPDKVLSPASLVELDARVYLEEAQFWDGWTRVGRKRSAIEVATTVKATADIMQAMAATVGLLSTIKTTAARCDRHKEVYTVAVRVGIPPAWRVDWEPHQARPQMVYCAQVPSGLLLIRRNNRVSVQGNCNFGLLFGIGAPSFASYADIDQARAQTLIDLYFKERPRLRDWQAEQRRQSSRKWAETPLGRRVSLVARDDEGAAYVSKTRALNVPIQGGCAEVMLHAIARVDKALGDQGLDACLLLTVHDELIVESSEADKEAAATVLVDEMRAAFLDVYGGREGAEACARYILEAEISTAWGGDVLDPANLPPALWEVAELKRAAVESVVEEADTDPDDSSGSDLADLRDQVRARTADLLKREDRDRVRGAYREAGVELLDRAPAEAVELLLARLDEALPPLSKEPAHALLGPSSASRWTECPGSIEAESSVRRYTGEAAYRGKLAHALVEWQVVAGLGPDKVGDIVEHYPELAELVAPVAEWIQSLPGDVRVEERVTVDEVLDIWGTADVLVIEDNRITVADLKAGKIRVSAERNLQLFAYAIGARNRYGRRDSYRLAILQPSSSPDPDVVTVTDEDLDVAEAKMLAAGKLVHSDNPPRHAGSHCRWCAARSDCPARNVEETSS